MLQGTASEVQALIVANPEYSNDLDHRHGYTHKLCPLRWKKQVIDTLSKCPFFVKTGIKQGSQNVFFYDL
jgi:hypothetical protein